MVGVTCRSDAGGCFEAKFVSVTTALRHVKAVSRAFLSWLRKKKFCLLVPLDLVY